MQHDPFARLAQWTAQQCGRGSTFILSIAVIVVWAATGPWFYWSDTWQLLINTGTNLITFLMVFLIQNTQNRDSEATQRKLDELLRVDRAMRLRALDLGDLSDAELDRLRRTLAEIAEKRANGTDAEELVGTGRR